MSLVLEADPKTLKKQFLSLKTREDIAALLDIEIHKLLYLLYAVPEANHYHTYTIRKNLGGVREISAPTTSIKILQKKLNQVLQAVYVPRETVHSYVRGAKRSILSNAKAHIKQHLVFSIDLRDYFPSINFGRVQGMFMHPPYSLNYDVSTTLAKLCCFNRALPQGAPTSPIISNMICSKLDRQLAKIARDNNCVYTRYADDITLSTNDHEFSKHILIVSDEKLELGKELDEIITSNGFITNQDKVKLRAKDERQVVTGVITNIFPNVRREYIRRVRGMFHAWEKYGLSAAEVEFRTIHDKKQRSEFKKPVLFKHSLKGKIEYIGMIRGKNDPIYLHFLNKLRILAPELVKIQETPMQFLIRTSREVPVNSVIKSVQSIQGDVHALSRLLAAVDPTLETKRLGVWQTFHGQSSDRLTQACHSMREVMRLLLDKLAPTEKIKVCKWYKKPTDSKTEVTRKMRVRYSLSGESTSLSKSTLEYIDSLARFVDESYDKLSSEAHSSKESDIALVEGFLQSGDLIISMILMNKKN
jgi:RNA-directed DNA polymerase